MKKEINSFLESLKISDEKNLDRTELQNQQEFLHKAVSSYLDTYQDKNSVEAKEYMCYLAAAIYLSYKKLYPNRTQCHLKNPYKACKYKPCRDLAFYSNSIVPGGLLVRS